MITEERKTQTAWQRLSAAFSAIESLDRRWIYLFIAGSLVLPIVLNITLPPAEMATARAFYNAVEGLERESNPMVLIAADWGPGTMAENKPQTILAIEHLMRRRVPFALISLLAIAAPFLDELPKEVAKRLEEEIPGSKWEYGKDWVNLGFRPGGIVMIQGLAKTSNLIDVLKVDAYGTPLQYIPAMTKVRSIKDITMLMEFTGSVGAFNVWVQFFQGPVFVHGCTSVTIPEAYIYYASKQIVGFFEGLAGAAYYESLLNNQFAERQGKSEAIATNTGLSFAQLVVLGFIVLGNIAMLLGRAGAPKKGAS